MAEVRIDIASEFRDKGFKKAEKATSSLERSFKRLGGTLASVFAARQIIAFGRASVRAFEQDQLAATRLTKTLENLNLGFEDPRVKAFISNLESQTGILDDQLRPAMQSLLTTTASVTKSQELLNLAIEVSRGTGIALTTVTSDLAKAYVGNNRGLLKYNLGLSKTEMQAKSFYDIQKLLNDQFSGQSSAYLETYAGKMGLLNVAFANAQETIGEGLVDAFIILAGENGIPGATNKMADFAEEIGNVSRGIAIVIKKLDDLTSWGGWSLLDVSNIPIAGAWLDIFAELGKKKPKPFKVPMTISGQTDLYTKQDKERDRLEKERLRREKQLAALTKKQEEARKKAAALEASRKRAATIFDMENIQIVAAMQGQVDGEQRMRLTALLALNTENYKAAEKLSDIIVRLNAPALANLGVMIEAGDTIDKVIQKLIMSQAKLAGLQLMAEDFPELENIFEDWETSLQNILDMLMQMFALLGKNNAVNNTGLSSMFGRAPNPMGAVARGEYADVYGNLVGSSSANVPMGGATRGEYSSYIPQMSSSPSVVVNVAGNVTTQSDLVQSITNALYQSQKDGKNILYSSTAI